MRPPILSGTSSSPFQPVDRPFGVVRRVCRGQGPVSRMWLTSSEGQPEADLRRPRLGRHMLQVLQRVAFDGPDPPVRTIEYIEYFRDPVDGGAAVQRNPLLQPQ